MIEVRTGVELLNRYVIQEYIGAGGYGMIWKATDKELGRNVAIKRLLKESLSAESSELLKEAKKASILTHDNIVQIYDIQKIDGEDFLIMEHVDGTSLWQLLRDSNKKGELIPVDKAVSILKNILSGISYAHSKGICHRDVSPMNMLVTKWGNPKISDFGIARVLSTENIDDSPQGGTGHPYFMSPEQAKGEPADFTSDLFMVGDLPPV